MLDRQYVVDCDDTNLSNRWRVKVSDSRLARLAVLIDGENASPQVADGLFGEIAKLGETSVRRIYGDFSSPRLKKWADILAQHAILPHQQFANIAGKNASDIALVIDAMDLLHSGRCDGFCLVSSDSDFTRLASRIREHGVQVFGFGERKTPESLRRVCHRFIYTENLVPDARAQAENSATKSLQHSSAATPLLKKVIAQMESEDGWVDLGAFGSRLDNIFSDFDSRTYGEKKLSDLVRKTDAFEVDQPEGGRLRMRLKVDRAKAKKGPSGRKAANKQQRPEPEASEQSKR
jgi:hypothetical protein